MANEMKEIVNEEEALQILGIPTEETPATAVSTEEKPVEKSEATEDAVSTESHEAKEEVKEEKLTPAERAKRWQQTAEQRRVEYEREKARGDALTQALEATRALVQRIGLPEVKPTEPTKEPKISDFTQGITFDKYDAFDPQTQSGIAYQRYQEAREKWVIGEAVAKSRDAIKSETKRESQQTMLQKRARKLADKYPQFKDPLSGEPDYEKIKGWLNQVSEKAGDDEWLTFMEYLDWKGKKNGATVKAETRLDRAANKAGSVASTTPVEDEVELSEDDKAFGKYFGQVPDLR